MCRQLITRREWACLGECHSLIDLGSNRLRHESEVAVVDNAALALPFAVNLERIPCLPGFELAGLPVEHTMCFSKLDYLSIGGLTYAQWRQHGIEVILTYHDHRQFVECSNI